MSIATHEYDVQEANQKTERQTDAKEVTIDKLQGRRHSITKEVGPHFHAPVDVLTVYSFNCESY